jgi:hypothetical protein
MIGLPPPPAIARRLHSTNLELARRPRPARPPHGSRRISRARRRCSPPPASARAIAARRGYRDLPASAPHPTPPPLTAPGNQGSLEDLKFLNWALNARDLANHRAAVVGPGEPWRRAPGGRAGRHQESARSSSAVMLRSEKDAVIKTLPHCRRARPSHAGPGGADSDLEPRRARMGSL